LQAADGKWHHYVVVYTGQAVIVYLDHIKVAEEEFVGEWPTTANTPHA